MELSEVLARATMIMFQGGRIKYTTDAAILTVTMGLGGAYRFN